MQTIYNAITNGTPCVVMEGSGRVADVIAQVAGLPVSEITISRVQEKLSLFFQDAFETLSESRIVEWTKKVSSPAGEGLAGASWPWRLRPGWRAARDDGAAVPAERPAGFGRGRPLLQAGQGQRSGEPGPRPQGRCQATATGARVWHSLQAWRVPASPDPGQTNGGLRGPQGREAGEGLWGTVRHLEGASWTPPGQRHRQAGPLLGTAGAESREPSRPPSSGLQDQAVTAETQTVTQLSCISIVLPLNAETLSFYVLFCSQGGEGGLRGGAWLARPSLKPAAPAGSGELGGRFPAPLAPMVTWAPLSLLLSEPGAAGPPVRAPDLCFTAGSWLGVGLLDPQFPQ